MLDQISDINGAALYQISQSLILPDFVKEASIADVSEIESLEHSCFAHPSQRKFPIHTKADTWLSCAYFSKIAHEVPEGLRDVIQSNLDRACSLWEVSLEQNLEKSASDIEKGYEVNFDFGDSEHQTYVKTPDQMNKVASHILDSVEYPYSTRKDIAQQIIASPDTLKEDLTNETLSTLHKMAGYGVGTINSARNAIKQRKNSMQGHFKGFREKLDGLDSILKEAASENNQGLLSSDLLTKTAALLDAVDRVTLMCYRYSDSFRPGFEQIFETTIHDMDSFSKEAVELPCGKYVSKRDLRLSKAGAWLERCFGQKTASEDELIDAIKKMSSRSSEILYTHIKSETGIA